MINLKEKYYLVSIDGYDNFLAICKKVSLFNKYMYQDLITNKIIYVGIDNNSNNIGFYITGKINSSITKDELERFIKSIEYLKYKKHFLEIEKIYFEKNNSNIENKKIDRKTLKKYFK